MYAFVLIHFGSNPKYLELELYFLLNLRRKTSYDIVYMYSVNDTPTEFIKAVKKICPTAKAISYDDNNITYNIQNFQSFYEHFNTLRTCNFIFANQLTQYEKVCVLESDMVIRKNVDDIFLLNCPAGLYHPSRNEYINSLVPTINKKQILQNCPEKSDLNGGLFLFKPDKSIIKTYINNIKLVVEHNCRYPNEILILYTNPVLYNMPMQYNFPCYYFNKWSIKNKQNHPISIYHFSGSVYKQLDIIKDGWVDKLENGKKKEVVLYFKNNYYNQYHKVIDEIMKKFIQ